MSSDTQISAIDGNPNPFERDRFEFGGILTRREIDPVCGLVEVRLRTELKPRREHEDKDDAKADVVYPHAYAGGELGTRLLARRTQTPLLLRGRLKPYKDKDSKGRVAIYLRYVVDEILSTNSTNLPGLEFDRDIVEFGGLRGEVSEPKRARNKSEFRLISLVRAGVTEDLLPVRLSVFDRLGEEIAALAPNSGLCVQAVERTYPGRGAGGGYRMRRSTSVTEIVESAPPVPGVTAESASVTEALSELSTGLESRPAF